ncbi:hypothetical protein METP3_00647 [Methanosarcinales archaeon]|nr:hypothetical protein METP3_00647 [Methanosarcinales archaeon]
MKIIENMTNGYRKIASGIAIVAFLTLMYFALIPGGTMAAVYTTSGATIQNAFVRIVEYPEYNASTDINGNYQINSVPYDAIAGGSTYTMRVKAAGYGPNSTKVTLNSVTPNPAVNWELYPSDPLYIGFLNDDGTNYISEIQVFNPYNFNITVDDPVIRLGVNKTTDYEILPLTLNSIQTQQVWGGSFIGSVKVETTQPAKVQGLLKTINTGIYSIAPARNISSETIQYIPFLNDAGTAATRGYDSGIQIFNPDPVTTINANISAIRLGESRSINIAIPPMSLAGKMAEQVWGGDFLGSIKVETDGPALVQGNLRTLYDLTASIAPSRTISSETIQYIPFLNDAGTAATNGYDSGIQVFNPDPVNTISANITAIRLGESRSINIIIPPMSLGGKMAEQVWGGDFLGSIKVETNGTALVQGNLRTLSTSTASIAPAMTIPTVATMYIPYLKDNGTTYDSGIQIFNPYQTDTINATITTYNLLDGQIKSLSFDIPPLSLGGKMVKNNIVGSDFEGAVKVDTKVGSIPRPALVQSNIRVRNTMTASIAPAIE